MRLFDRYARNYRDPRVAGSASIAGAGAFAAGGLADQTVTVTLIGAGVVGCFMLILSPLILPAWRDEKRSVWWGAGALFGYSALGVIIGVIALSRS